MTGQEFLRRLRALGRRKGVEVYVDARRGKGSHAVIYFGDRKAASPDRRKRLAKGTLKALVRQLGISEDDLY